MLTLNFEKGPFWTQAYRASFAELEGLDLYDRYRLIFEVAKEYVANINPSDEKEYTDLLHQEHLLSQLYSIDMRDSVMYETDAEALDRFVEGFKNKDRIQILYNNWSSSSYSQKEGTLFEIKRRFSEAFGIDFSVIQAKFDKSGMLNASANLDDRTIVVSDEKIVRDDFFKSFHSAVYGCALMYQLKSIADFSPEEGSERDHMVHRVYSDISPEFSLFWPTDRFIDYNNQFTRRHARWLADLALENIAVEIDPEKAFQSQQELNDTLRSRFLSHRVLYATQMHVMAAEDVWDTIIQFLNMKFVPFPCPRKTVLFSLLLDCIRKQEQFLTV